MTNTTIKSCSTEDGYPVITDNGKLSFCIDRGGTFTDVICSFPTNPGLIQKHGPVTHRTFKLLSVNPSHYPDAPSEAIRHFLEEILGTSCPRGTIIPSSRIESVRMGTTVATNALLERKGEPCVLITTQGLEDVMLIGTQARPAIFDLKILRPEPITHNIVGARERVLVSPTALPPALSESDSCSTNPLPIPVNRFERASTGETVAILRDLDQDHLRANLRTLRAQGIKSAAVAFSHSYAYPHHEKLAEVIAREEGFEFVSLSSDLMPAVKLVPRAFTCAADAYLTPCIQAYLTRFLSSFDLEFSTRVPLQFMQSDGGLVSAKLFSGYRAVLSGPAGGVVGFSQTAYVPQTSLGDNDSTTFHDADTREGLIPGQPVIGFDMGGTSTDVSRYDGALDHVFENTTAGVVIQAPQLDINTVAAGGGSILTFSAGLFAAGPESASAFPGPACYRNSGPLTVTDANLILGRIQPHYFPRVFGPSQDMPLDSEASHSLFIELSHRINAFQRQKQIENGILDSDITPPMSPEDVALGFVSVANEAMCRPIRGLTESRGFDPANHSLACFGAAGGQHACAVAEALGIRTVHIHRHSGVLSAFGMGLASLTAERQAPCLQILAMDLLRTAADLAVNLEKATREELLVQVGSSFDKTSQKCDSSTKNNSISTEVYFSLRYTGTDTQTMITLPESVAQSLLSLSCDNDNRNEDTLHLLSSILNTIMDLFKTGYIREYGFTLDREVLLDSVRVRSEYHSKSFEVVEDPTESVNVSEDTKIRKRTCATAFGFAERARPPTPLPAEIVNGYFPVESVKKAMSSLSESISGSISGSLSESISPTTRGVWCNVPVFLLNQLAVGAFIVGPAILVDATSTLLVDPCWAAVVNTDGIVLHALSTPNESESKEETVKSETSVESSLPSLSSAPLTPCDPVLLSIFSHRFMSIAEQMGRVLQRSSVSTNIKERLDFSCAIFGPDGGLVANAPHLPVHLGAMQEAVRSQIAHLGSSWGPGDVIMSNHPGMGGSHLPDITVITPVFVGNSPKASFYVASRGHHSDIGGSVPGSMPPFSTTLQEEGVAIRSFLLVDGATSKFRLAEVTAVLTCADVSVPPGHPRPIGARNVSDNLSDLQAQVAANHRGCMLMATLVASYTLPTVQAFMSYIQDAAAEAVREMLCQVSLAAKLPVQGSLPLTTDWMDDGTPIVLRVSIDRQSRSAEFDFTGSGPAVFGNTNAPRSVALSAVIYSLRCMVTRDIPLNQGCLTPVRVIVPENSILNPPPHAAVVGGNVLTSQRVTDVILKAFSACAASQGCMNNFCFGNESFGYYETIAGGAGAGPGWIGASGVHTHMTNTRITDPEVLERRYPVLLRQFRIRKGSGGIGKWHGGDGVVREVEFLAPMVVSLLTERRVKAPFGLAGGGDAKKGENYHVQYRNIFETSSQKDEEIQKSTKADGKESLEYYSDQYHGRDIKLLPGKTGLSVKQGEGILIKTPGGGGWGHEEAEMGLPLHQENTPAFSIPAKTGSLAAYSANQESA